MTQISKYLWTVGFLFSSFFATLGWTAADDIQGPTILSLTARPNPSDGAPFVELRALIDDTMTGRSRVAGAEFFVDRPGVSGSGQRMTGLRDTFTNVAETATGWLDISAWKPGEGRSIHVHGQDENGNWGAFLSLSLAVTGAPPFSLNFVSQAETLVKSASTTRFIYVVNQGLKKAELTIFNSLNQVVRSLSSQKGTLPTVTGVTAWVWEGKDDQGAWVPPGLYRCQVTVQAETGAFQNREVTLRVVDP